MPEHPVFASIDTRTKGDYGFNAVDFGLKFFCSVTVLSFLFFFEALTLG